MDEEAIKQLANDVNNVVLATAKPYQEQIRQLKTRISKLEQALTLTKNMLCCGESFTKESRHMVEQVLKPDEPKMCICCEEITEENAHLHRNCGK